ncbi:MAG: group II intron reverse transcriptase domain-containing protein [Bacteroidales bacterium]|nr:group II intron reverse transcriptase domain-containing protein [Bacteroidales bacterium]
MSLLQLLDDKGAWLDFLEYKRRLLPPKCNFLKRLKKYVAQEGYHEIATGLMSGSYHYDLPAKTTINKNGTSKKRVIYRFDWRETMVLKLLTHLLYKYDYKICGNCYSFRRNTTAKDAVNAVSRIKKLDQKFVLKIDVSNYFNSIPSSQLADAIAATIDDDPQLAAFIIRLIKEDAAYLYGNGTRTLIRENRGAMAGVPVSAFCANIYLDSLDRRFDGMGVDYFRYSDDILIIADSMSKVEEYQRIVNDCLSVKGLKINEKKLHISRPGEGFDFLGFVFYDGNIDLAASTLQKAKAKIRRKAKSLMRRRNRLGESFDMAASDLAAHFNRKFYDEEHDNGFTWSRWFFPSITTSKSLKIIDQYLEQYMRYLSTGRHTKKNYNVRYETLKELGFRSLVAEYYNFISELCTPRACRHDSE